MRSRLAVLVPLFGAVLASLALPATAEAGIFDGLDEGFTAALESGNWAVALPLIYLVGLATALTPCVYPMIVITVSVFGARQAKTKTEGALLSTSFVAGMVTLFTPLGVIVPLTGAAFGSWLTHPVVVIGFAVLFTAMALAMFGAWELNLPPSLQNKLGQVGGIGVKGAFGLGAASALIAAPCTGPALVGLLAWIATTGDVVLGAICMATYALGLGTLFWMVGTFAVSLPKSGRWMEMVKSVFGIVLLVMALYYLRLLAPSVMDWLSERADAALAIGILLVLIGLGVGAVHLDFHEPDAGVRVRKGAGVALSTTGGSLFAAWLVAVPPVPAGAEAIQWREDFEPAIAEARAAGRPYMIDFGADWCGACGELERNTFTNPEVAAEAARFVNIHVDMSAHSVTPASRALLASYDQRGLPLVVLHDADGNEVHRVTQFVEAEELLRLMHDVE